MTSAVYYLLNSHHSRKCFRTWLGEVLPTKFNMQNLPCPEYKSKDHFSNAESNEYEVN